MIASSAVTDAGIGSWDLRTATEHLRYRSCASPPHGLVSIGGRFLASSQVPSSSSSTPSIFYWSWDKPQIEVRSFPAEHIGPLRANSEGTYVLGGGKAGSIYLWEVASGKLLKKWQAHYRAVTCLTFSHDESFLISGSEDGGVKVWNLVEAFDVMKSVGKRIQHFRSFTDHSSPVTDVVSGYGSSGDSIFISSSEDRTCKIRTLSSEKLLRSIEFPSIINAIAIDPGEHVFYAAGAQGKIYIAALNAECLSSDFGKFIIGVLSDQSTKSVNCLALSGDGFTLISGSDDGSVRAWDTIKRLVISGFKHAKGSGPVNNVLITRHPFGCNPQGPLNWQINYGGKPIHVPMPPPLDRHVNSVDGHIEAKPVIGPQCFSDVTENNRFRSSIVMKSQIEELQKQGSSGAAEMELEKLKSEFRISAQMVQQWRTKYQDLYKLCVDELLDNRDQPS